MNITMVQKAYENTYHCFDTLQEAIEYARKRLYETGSIQIEVLNECYKQNAKKVIDKTNGDRNGIYVIHGYNDRVEKMLYETNAIDNVIDDAYKKMQDLKYFYINK